MDKLIKDNSTDQHDMFEPFDLQNKQWFLAGLKRRSLRAEREFQHIVSVTEVQRLDVFF